MKTNALSTCFCTTNMDACREFYQQFLSAEITFDCGWYVNMRFDGGEEIQFMLPQEGMEPFGGAGVVLNFEVDDVDAEHARLTAAGLTAVVPLEDHPWGDRGLSVLDPIGNAIYIYSDREPTEEFRQYYRT